MINKYIDLSIIKKVMKKDNKLYIIIVIIILCSGCQTIKSTSRYYKNITSESISPKPNDYKVPIIRANETKRAYKIIGEMEFESGSSESFVIKSISYNARINGADAVILKEWKKEENTYVSYQPSYFRTHFPYYYRACDNGFYFHRDFHMMYEFESNTYITHKIKAQMIIFLDHDTFGFLGFIFEKTKNTDYLEIGKIILNSPAQKAGLQVGDKINKIGPYLCNQGYDNYCIKTPVYKVGQEYDIEFERDGMIKKITLIAEKMESIIEEK